LTAAPILFLHSSDEAFGSDRVVLALVELALSQGRAVRVLLPDDTPPGWLTRQLQARGVQPERRVLAPVRRRYLHLRSLAPYAWSLLRASAAIRAEARRCPSALIHVGSSTVVAAAALGRSRRRVVWHVQELQVNPRALAWLFRVIPIVAASHVIAISEYTAGQLNRSRLGRARIHRVYNGLPARPAEPRAARRPGAVRCAYVGRLQRRKGYDLFVEAAARVAPRFPETRFVLAGTPALVRRIAELGLAERVEILGMCNDVPALLEEIDIVVLPSRWPESFGLVMVEAMRAGCAVIATDHGAAPEIARHGVSGLLVPPGDPQALAEGMAQLLARPDMREQLARAGQQRAREAFSREAFERQVAAVWKQAAP
jgi:glycosyltransferase involved in cell wall biosynthesis